MFTLYFGQHLLVFVFCKAFCSWEQKVFRPYVDYEDLDVLRCSADFDGHIFPYIIWKYTLFGRSYMPYKIT